MNKTKYPTPIDRAIKLDPSQVIMSKMDSDGTIEYANDYFMEICGYEVFELMGKSVDVLRHPDMPEVIVKLIWERLNKGKNIHALVKNIAKDGSFYWMLTNFKTKYNKDGSIQSHYANRKAAPNDAIFQIEKLYKILLGIEKGKGSEIAEKYFQGLLEEKQQTYDEFILGVLNVPENSLKAYFKDVLVVDKPT